jgi:hypothetical protein
MRTSQGKPRLESRGELPLCRAHPYRRIAAKSNIGRLQHQPILLPAL